MTISHGSILGLISYYTRDGTVCFEIAKQWEPITLLLRRYGAILHFICQCLYIQMDDWIGQWLAVFGEVSTAFANPHYFISLRRLSFLFSLVSPISLLHVSRARAGSFLRLKRMGQA